QRRRAVATARVQLRLAAGDRRRRRATRDAALGSSLRARHEPRLRRWHEVALSDRPKRRADRFSGERAEAGSAEVTVAAGGLWALGHGLSATGDDTTHAGPRTRCPGRKLTKLRGVST